MIDASAGGFRSFYQRFGLVFVLEGVAALRRSLDILFTVGVLTVLAPLWLGLLALLAHRRRPLWTFVPMIGRWCEPYREYRFAVPPGPTGAILQWLHLDRLPRLLNLLRGDLSLIGPRPLEPAELTPMVKASRAHFDVRPGLFQLVWTRDPRVPQNVDERQGTSNGRHTVFRQDLQTMIRAFPTILYTGGALWAPAQVRLLGLGLDNLTLSEAAQAVQDLLARKCGGQVALVTSEHATIAHQDTAYREVLERARLRLPASRTLQLAAKILGQELRSFITPEMLVSRLFEAACFAHRADRIGRVFLLAPDEKRLPGLVARFIRKWPEVTVCGSAAFPGDATGEESLPAMIRASGADLLLAAVPAPALEVWLDRRHEDLFPVLALGLGSWLADDHDQSNGQEDYDSDVWQVLGMGDLRSCWRQSSGTCSLRVLANATLLVRVLLERAGRPSPAPRFEIPKF